jgi:hypothetical protein
VTNSGDQATFAAGGANSTTGSGSDGSGIDVDHDREQLLPAGPPAVGPLAVVLDLADDLVLGPASLIPAQARDLFHAARIGPRPR